MSVILHRLTVPDLLCYVYVQGGKDYCLDYCSRNAYVLQAPCCQLEYSRCLELAEYIDVTDFPGA